MEIKKRLSRFSWLGFNSEAYVIVRSGGLSVELQLQRRDCLSC